MNDDVKKALELAPLGYKADHAQLWMHLQILAEHIKNEPARTKTANEAAIMEWRAGAADRDELRADCEQRIAAASERANEGVRYWTDLAQAEARDAAALRERVAELEAVLRDTCREKVLHGHTTTLLTDALRLKVPGVENYEDWAEERESKLQKAEARIKELESVLDGYGARDLQEMSEKLKAAEVRTKNLEAAYAAISPQTIEKWRNGELTAGELISFGHETGLLTRAKVLEAQIAAARKLAEEFSKDTFDSSGETAAAGFQVLAAMDEAAKGIT